MPKRSWETYFTQLYRSYHGIKHSSSAHIDYHTWYRGLVANFAPYIRDEDSDLFKLQTVYAIEGPAGCEPMTLYTLQNNEFKLAMEGCKAQFEAYKKDVRENQNLKKECKSLENLMAKFLGDDCSALQLGGEKTKKLIKKYLEMRALDEVFIEDKVRSDPIPEFKLLPPSRYYYQFIHDKPKGDKPLPTFSEVIGKRRLFNPFCWIDLTVGSAASATARLWLWGVNNLKKIPQRCCCDGSCEKCSLPPSGCSKLLSNIGNVFDFTVKLPAVGCMGIKTITYGLAMMTNGGDGCSEMGNFYKSLSIDVRTTLVRPHHHTTQSEHQVEIDQSKIKRQKQAKAHYAPPRRRANSSHKIVIKTMGENTEFMSLPGTVESKEEKKETPKPLARRKSEPNLRSKDWIAQRSQFKFSPLTAPSQHDSDFLNLYTIQLPKKKSPTSATVHLYQARPRLKLDTFNPPSSETTLTVP